MSDRKKQSKASEVINNALPRTKHTKTIFRVALFLIVFSSFGVWAQNDFKTSWEYVECSAEVGLACPNPYYQAGCWDSDAIGAEPCDIEKCFGGGISEELCKNSYLMPGETFGVPPSKAATNMGINIILLVAIGININILFAYFGGKQL